MAWDGIVERVSADGLSKYCWRMLELMYYYETENRYLNYYRYQPWPCGPWRKTAIQIQGTREDLSERALIKLRRAKLIEKIVGWHDGPQWIQQYKISYQGRRLYLTEGVYQLGRAPAI